MLRQYMELKEQAPDCILFFRMGDFYEMFFEDAQAASRVLSITLTSRDKGPDPVPMCGVPHHAADQYLAKLVEAGFKVAVCDQVENPRLAKGLVKREITRVISPGMFIDPGHLPAKSHRFLAALNLGRETYGLACLDLASGEFRAVALPPGPSLGFELARLEPAELVLAESQQGHPQLAELGQAVSELPRSYFPGRPPSPAQARQTLEGRLPSASNEEDQPALVAATMLWEVVTSTQRRVPEHVGSLELYQVRSHLLLDATARRNLELFRSIAGGSRQGSLIQAVDMTSTPMGGRLLREWLGFPLLEIAAIEARQQAVEELTLTPLTVDALEETLARLSDIPRLVGRASLGQAGPRDLTSLRDTLSTLPRLKERLDGLSSPLLRECARHFTGQETLATRLAASLAERPPLNLSEGGVIATGVSEELDKQRAMASSGKGWIAAMQTVLRVETGIASLKVGFNKVFGYYLEVTNAHKDKVPASFIRKQTLAGAERYITQELKAREEAVLGAEEKALELELTLFEKLRQKVSTAARGLLAAARAAATVDVLTGLARLALSHDYVRPRLTEEGAMVIVGGRHPVVERMLGPGEFVPNDLNLGGTDNQVLIITGPNMAGKSTILRQVALICLLAQAGSFVPAKKVSLPLVDRIFTRVGAMDDLARGRSTFMVEMTETAQILKQATPRSLVILDEVGRGTSTFDGLSLAWAAAEHLHDLQGVGVKTLFATHYHELTELAATHPRAKNYNVAAKEYRGEIVFLRRLTPGGANRSYGLQVAALAGLPASVLERARDILQSLEAGGVAKAVFTSAPEAGRAGQLDLFSTGEHPVLIRIRELDLSRMTPLAALTLLDELKRELD
jgi:DNA mismatch repair protein MutS